MLPNEPVANGHGRFSTVQQWFHDRIEAVKKAAPPGRLRAMGAKATETIKEHPIAAAATAMALGYVIVRAIRR